MYVIVIFIKSDREETSLVIDVMNVVNKCKKSNRFNFFGGSPLFTDLVSDVETVNYFSIGSSSSDGRPEVNLSAMSGYLAPIAIWRKLNSMMMRLGNTTPSRTAKKASFAIIFFRGFEYKEIILLLLKNHGIEMSLRTLKRRIKSYGLRRQQPEYNIDQVRASVPTIIDGHGSLQEYRSVWHTLQLRGTRESRVVVKELLREMDP